MSTRTGKGKKRKRIGKLRDPAQSARFVREAERLGLVTNKEEFERLIDKMFGKPPKKGS